MNDMHMSGNYPVDGEVPHHIGAEIDVFLFPPPFCCGLTRMGSFLWQERFKRLHMPPLRPAAIRAYNKRLRQSGFTVA